MKPDNDSGGTLKLYGAVEAGGTKFICAVGDQSGALLEEIRIETRAPSTTLAEVCQYFKAATERFGRLSALGVAAFGPLDLKATSPTFGFITSTPKPGWAHTDLAGTLRRQLDRPVYIDTDVNGAALAESRWGAGQHLDSVAYVTVGTGIGVGIVHYGKPVHGLMHPELGHISVRRHPVDLNFAGICPFHGDCLEGLASGPAVQTRIGCTLQDAAATDPIWIIEADYLGQLCALLVLSHSPERILMGGGVMQRPLYRHVRERMLHWLGNYVNVAALRSASYIGPPGLGAHAGIKGALSLALSATPEG